MSKDYFEQLGTYMTNTNLRVSEPFLNMPQDMHKETFTNNAINIDNFKKHSSTMRLHD